MENIIGKAAAGDQEAIKQIYEMTYPQGFSVALQMVKNREDASDILQEAYLSAFGNLNKLRDADKLKSWFNCIVANKCRDFLRKKNPLLFSDIERGEAEDSYEEQLQNDRKEFVPDESVDYSETKRLMDEILQSLSAEQRLTVLMYYYDELSVGEIATALECSAGTVKSRLNYARRKIKEEVLKLEKQGTKLYTMAPIPFIIWMLRYSEKTFPTAALSQAVELAKRAAVGGKAGAAAGSIMGKAMGKTAGIAAKATAVKVIAGTAAVAMVGAGCLAGINYYKGQQKHSIEAFKNMIEETYVYVGNQIITEVNPYTIDGEDYLIWAGSESGYIGFYQADFDADKQDEILLIRYSRIPEEVPGVHLDMYEYSDGWKEAISYDLGLGMEEMNVLDISWNQELNTIMLYFSQTDRDSQIKEVGISELVYKEGVIEQLGETYIAQKQIREDDTWFDIENGIWNNTEDSDQSDTAGNTSENDVEEYSVLNDNLEIRRSISDLDIDFPVSEQSETFVQLVRRTVYDSEDMNIGSDEYRLGLEDFT
ncbi:MAG: sigma-70 family RNA polymerase sigma factor [Clostridia bacterium]|nr:sigma-70 family RNA polymerase sigma factor [Clostridia bacterium]NCC42648.1 sigma-70 family RNA polymerase sigma factor [Clostridia bacterium]